MPICGSKLSTCGLLLSVWGIVQLSLTGLAFHSRSLAFLDDVRLRKSSYNHDDWSELKRDLEVGFEQSALNCWVAALCCLATLAISAQQLYMNNYRVSEVPKTKFENFASINSGN